MARFDFVFKFSRIFEIRIYGMNNKSRIKGMFFYRILMIEITMKWDLFCSVKSMVN